MSKVFSHAQISSITTIRRTRKMPYKAAVKVTTGEPVLATQVIAAAEAAAEHRVLRAAYRLDIPNGDLLSHMRKREGDIVERGEVIAEKPGFLGFIGRQRVHSPIDGRIARITDGKIVLAGGVRRNEVKAALPGRVTTILAGEQIIIENTGTVIQVAWGHGGLDAGVLKTMDRKPGTTTDPSRFNVDHRNSIVAIGSPLTEEFLRGAVEIKVKGIIASSMHANLLPIVRQLSIPIALTQGFGHLPMSLPLFNLLTTYNGREVVLNMQPDGDWRENRLEIIIPLETLESPRDRDESLDIQVGGRVRILQSPYMGDIGTIRDIPDDYQQLGSGLWLQGVMAETSSGETIFVPFANLEYLG